MTGEFTTEKCRGNRRLHLFAAPGAVVVKAADALSTGAAQGRGITAVIKIAREGIVEESPDPGVQLLSVREYELVLARSRRDGDFGAQIPLLERNIGDRTEINREILHPERCIQGGNLEVDGTVGQFDDAAGGDEPADEVDCFLHEDRFFARYLHALLP